MSTEQTHDDQCSVRRTDRSTDRPSSIRSTSRRSLRLGALGALLVLVASLVMPSLDAGADQLANKRAEAARVADELQALEDRLMDLGAQFDRASHELAQAEERIVRAEEFLAQTDAELERSREAIRRYAVQAYQSGGDSMEVEALLTNDPTTGAQKRSYLQDIAGNRRDLIDSLNGAQVKVEEDRARLEIARSEAEARRAELQQAKAQEEEAAASQRALNARVQGELASLVAAENARRVSAARAAAAARRGSLPDPPPAGSGASGAIAAALSRVGAPYSWGSDGPDSFDCSGLMVWSYARVGVSLPHYSGSQYNMTTSISRSQLAPGDLVFWGSGGSDHVALYIGNGQIVHAFRSGRNVAVTHLDGWWKTPSKYGRLNY